MNTDVLAIEPGLAHWIGWTLLHSIWQGTALAAILAVVLRWAIPRRAANVRYLAACATLVAMAALPPLTPRPSFTPTNATSSPSLAFDELAMMATQVPVAPSWGEWALERGQELTPWLAGAWLIGVVVLAARLLGGWAWSRRLSQRSARSLNSSYDETLKRLCKKLGVRRAVRLLESSVARTPAVLGWSRPVILLPVAAMTGLTTAQLEAILAHELAHIRRYDYLINLIQCVLEALLFHHPAAWRVSRIIREERENCCDDLAVAACGSRKALAQALARLESLRSEPSMTLALPLSLAADGGPLLNRIRRILEQDLKLKKDVRNMNAKTRLQLPPVRDVVGLAALALTAVGLALIMTARDAQAQAQTPRPGQAEAAANNLVDTFEWVAEFKDEPDVAYTFDIADVAEFFVESPLSDQSQTEKKPSLTLDSPSEAPRYSVEIVGPLHIDSPHSMHIQKHDQALGEGGDKAKRSDKSADLMSCTACHQTMPSHADVVRNLRATRTRPAKAAPKPAEDSQAAATSEKDATRQVLILSDKAQAEAKKTKAKVFFKAQEDGEPSRFTRTWAFKAVPDGAQAPAQDKTAAAPSSSKGNDDKAKLGLFLRDPKQAKPADGNQLLRWNLALREAPEDAQPSDREIVAKLKLAPDGDVQRENVQIRIELLSEKVEGPKIYPIAGRCELVRRHYKCTVQFDEKASGVASPKNRIEVIYLDKDFLRPCPAAPKPAPASAPTPASAQAKEKWVFEAVETPADREKKVRLFLKSKQQPSEERAKPAPAPENLSEKLDAVIQDLERIKSKIKP